MLFLLDTTVLIDFLRGRRAVVRVRGLRASGDLACTTGINIDETVRGLRPNELEAAHDLFAGLEVLPIGEEEGWRAGTWRRDYASRGITLWQADCLVAASALSAGAIVATGNPKDFPMDGLQVETWPVGE